MSVPKGQGVKIANEIGRRWLDISGVLFGFELGGYVQHACHNALVGCGAWWAHHGRVGVRGKVAGVACDGDICGVVVFRGAEWENLFAIGNWRRLACSYGV